MIRRLLTVASLLLLLPSPEPVHAAGQPTSASAECRYALVGRVDGAAHGVHSPFTRDGRAFLTAGGDSVRVWDAATLRPITEPLRHPGLQFYRLASAGDTLLTANADEVRVWDVATGRLRSATRVSKRKLELVEFAPDGRRFVTIEHDRDDAGRLWQIADGAFESMALGGEEAADHRAPFYRPAVPPASPALASWLVPPDPLLGLGGDRRPAFGAAVRGGAEVVAAGVAYAFRAGGRHVAFRVASRRGFASHCANRRIKGQRGTINARSANFQ